MRPVRWLIVLSLLLLLTTPAVAQPLLTKATAHITSATTTTVVTGVSGVIIGLWSASICVDTGGAQSTITLQDSGGTNLIGTGIVYVVTGGACLWFPYRGSPYPYQTAAGTGLQIVTGGAGPVEVVMEVSK